MIRKRLGDALVDAGLVTAEQLSEALVKQKELGKRLGKVLAEMKLCTDEQIAKALAGQLGINFIEMDEISVPPEVLRLIPETIVRSHTLLPVARKGNVLTVAMADPLDAFIVDEIRYQTNFEVEEAIAPESAILDVIRRYFGSEDMSSALRTIKKDDQGDLAALPEDANAFDLMATDEAAVVNFVSKIIRQAINDKASDIHLEPEEDGLRIRFRIDGVLVEIVRVPKAN
ncbi:MAG TPA: type II secretion system protein GspE, partial [Candidatus Ozemobacteraceae bacterium]|nr:type II secretion system protein GspE [Candidatus Ozemobacteraceae bacterium]